MEHTIHLKLQKVIFLRHSSPTAEGIDFKEAYTITADDFENINKRSLVQNGDILFSMIGSG